MRINIILAILPLIITLLFTPPLFAEDIQLKNNKKIILEKKQGKQIQEPQILQTPEDQKSQTPKQGLKTLKPVYQQKYQKPSSPPLLKEQNPTLQKKLEQRQTDYFQEDAPRAYPGNTDQEMQQASYPCEGINCGPHGTCVATQQGTARCLCDDGYIAVGSTCIETASKRDYELQDLPIHELEETPITIQPTTPVTIKPTTMIDNDSPQQLGIFDFQITRVTYTNQTIFLYFTSGKVQGSIYRGPLNCRLEILNHTYNLEIPNAALMYFSFHFEWPKAACASDWKKDACPCHFTYSATINYINYNNPVPEVNRDNNLFEGKIFQENRNRVSMRFLPDLYGDGDKEMDFLWERKWICGSNRNLQEDEVSEDPGYDPYDHFLYAHAGVWIENCNREGGQAIVKFNYISYDRERTIERIVYLLPGQKKYVETGLSLKIREQGNFVKVSVERQGGYNNVPDYCTIDLTFAGLPWNWQ